MYVKIKAKIRRKKALISGVFYGFSAFVAIPTNQLFPLDGPRGFGRDVVNDPVDAADFVDDAVHIIWRACSR
jgi:hypothetical protein